MVIHHPSLFVFMNVCIQLLSVDPGHIAPLICCQPTTSWVHLVYCRVISCHKTNCSSSRLFSVCLYFCLAYVTEDIFLTFPLHQRKKQHESSSFVESLNSWNEKWKSQWHHSRLHPASVFMSVCECVKYLRRLRTLLLWACRRSMLVWEFDTWLWKALALKSAGCPPSLFFLQMWVNCRTWHVLVPFNHGDVWREIWVWQQLKHVY